MRDDLKRIFALLTAVSFFSCAATTNTQQVSVDKEVVKSREVIKKYVEKVENNEKYSTVEIKTPEVKEGVIQKNEKVLINTATLEKSLKKNLKKRDVEVGLVKEPPLPIVIPPKVIRILIFPYIDSSGNFHSPEYVFTEIKKSRWVVGDYNAGREGASSKSFTILER